MGQVTQEGLSFYDMLCLIRTSVLNAIVESALRKTPTNISKLLDSVGDEIFQYFDFERELFELDEDELLDLGFDYLDNNTTFMLIPVWLYAFLPNGATLLDIEGEVFVKGTDAPRIHGNQWMNVGFFYDEITP
jgi:hypothetical protein